MRVLAVSVAPLFPGFVMGGSQRILMDVAAGLGRAGHEVRVLCTRLPENADGFSPAPGVTVEPVLRLRGAFPSPYETAPHLLAETWHALSGAAAWADRIYLHADAIYMRGALGGKPVVRSLHDFVYEEALVSAFSLPAALTIVPSEYLKRCIEASAGRVAATGEIRVIPNGVQAPAWPVKPQPPAGVRPRGPSDVILLHPHRPQARKGIRESLLLAAELQKRLPDRRVRLLVPAYPAGSALDEATDAVGAVRAMAAEVGAADLLELHEWLSPTAMPGYYAFGDVTLCIGNFIESFGLVPVESVAAGTPAICARVGAFRELEGLAGIRHVAPGDIGGAAAAAISFITRKPDMKTAAREITERFSKSRMAGACVSAITGPLPDAPSGPQETARSSGSVRGKPTHWRLAPWCYAEGDAIYHDYLCRFASFPRLTAALAEDRGAVSKPQPGELAEEFEKAVRDGFLVPSL
jgi:glycosyltransferase involved in cell wall biosynthesis